MPKTIYNHGDKIGNCTYIKDSGVSSDSRRLADFVCKCGNIFTARIATVKYGTTTSCGCIHKEISRKTLTTHGLSKINGKPTMEYAAWTRMKDRCSNKNTERYPQYGGRGIVVCERWKNSYLNFFEDMGKKPSPTHSIERINVNGNYEPSNCKWATIKEQANNRQNSLYITFNEETKTLAQWCDKFCLSRGMILRRLQKINYIFDPNIFVKENYSKYSRYKKAI